jgi:hypothetical protein
MQADRLTGWQADRMTGWQVNRLTGWQADRLKSWQDDRLTGWQDDRMTGWQDDRLTGWQDDRMTGWQDERQTNKLYRTVYSIFLMISWEHSPGDCLLSQRSLHPLRLHHPELRRLQSWDYRKGGEKVATEKNNCFCTNILLHLILNLPILILLAKALWSRSRIILKPKPRCGSALNTSPAIVVLPGDFVLCRIRPSISFL